MGTHLVIVESAAKAKTIEKYLQSIPELKSQGTFKVMASFGHIRDLPSKEMGVNTDDWTVTYENLAKKREVISKLRAASKEAEKVYLASDPDREGAAISYHLRELLGLKRAKYERVAFHEITKKGIREAFLNPKDIDMAEVEAQEARRILDRVVGYELSPLLWRRFATSSLSAGRVQSAALKVVVRRSQEVQNHIPSVFWTCEATFYPQASMVTPLPAKAFYQGNLVTWDSEHEVREVIERFIGIKKWQATFSQKPVKKSPPPPFITSSLQQEAYQRYGIPAKRTMQLAQTLYETGLITYMRTDSTTISEDAQSNILAWIGETYGDTMTTPRQYATKNAHAQEAHECIRPTQVHLKGDDLEGDHVTPSHRKVYEMIRKRAIASQMAPAEYMQINYDISHPTWNPKKDIVFRGSTNILVQPGFLRLYKPVEEDAGDQEDTTTSNEWIRGFLEKKEPLPVIMDHLTGKGDATRPPPLYNEPALVKTLEKEGIGRPSTYATILDKLQEKGYVAKGNVSLASVPVKHWKWCKEDPVIKAEDDMISQASRDADRLVPTSLGERVVDYLQGVVPFLLDVSFTADMESDLDLICHRQKQKTHVLKTFYDRFHSAVQDASGVCDQKKSTAPATTSTSKKTTKGASELQPSKVLKEFSGADAVQTRYGPALYVRAEKRFVSITPFLEWRSKTLQEISESDVAFLTSFPKTVVGTSRTIAYGPYGLYIKDGEHNIPMYDKSMWDAVYDGTITSHQIDALQKKPTSSGWKNTKKGKEMSTAEKNTTPIKKKVTKKILAA